MTYYVGLYDEERSVAVSELEDWLSQEEGSYCGNVFALAS